MTGGVSEEILKNSLVLALVLSAAPLGLALLWGLFAAVLQAATQIQESLISFLPKTIIVILALVLSWRWAAGEACGCMRQTLEGIIMLGRGL